MLHDVVHPAARPDTTARFLRPSNTYKDIDLCVVFPTMLVLARRIADMNGYWFAYLLQWEMWSRHEDSRLLLRLEVFS